MNDTLDLVLIGKWYDMINSGEKTEEYREIKPYWIRRLCNWMHDPDSICKTSQCEECFKQDGYVCYPYEFVRFHRGYTKNAMTFKVKEVGYGIGKPKWGAPVNKSVLIIKLGERI